MICTLPIIGSKTMEGIYIILRSAYDCLLRSSIKAIIRTRLLDSVWYLQCTNLKQIFFGSRIQPYDFKR